MSETGKIAVGFNEKLYPVVITLRFTSQEEKEYFLGGLIDGWGENAASVFWDYTCDLPDAEVFFVTPFHDPEGETTVEYDELLAALKGLKEKKDGGDGGAEISVGAE